MKPNATLESLTGNIVFLALVAALCALVLVPLLRGDLTPEATTNIAIGALGCLTTMAAMAAAWHWRGKVQAPGDGKAPDAGNTTVTVPQAPPNPPVVVETGAGGG